MRRKPRVAWLPPALTDRLGTAPGVATVGIQSASFIRVLTGPGLSAPPNNEEIALVKDFANAGSGAVQQLTDLTLADIQSSGYRLRRVVGKIIVIVLQDEAVTGPTIFKVTAGLMVRRTNDGGQSAASTAALNADEISVSNIQNFADPWIWRRSWVMANKTPGALAIDPSSAVLPGSNIFGYGGSVHESSHVDAKTARIVGPEERLFLDISVEGVNGNAQDDPGAVLVVGDLRTLGSLRTTSGNRRNSTR